MSDLNQQIADAFTALMQRHDDKQAAIAELHRYLSERGLIPRVTLHKYMCRRGCQIAAVFAADGMTLCAVRDYKYSPGLNENVSVPAARTKNTLDGNRHWPSHVHDLGNLAKWGAEAGISMNCRHYRGTVLAVDIMAVVDGVVVGKPAAPTRLGITQM